MKCADGVHQRGRDTDIRRNSIHQRRHDIGICDVSDLASDVAREFFKIARTAIDGNDHRPLGSEGQSGGVTNVSAGSDHDCDGSAHDDARRSRTSSVGKAANAERSFASKVANILWM
jgi:hypothetical protein